MAYAAVCPLGQVKELLKEYLGYTILYPVHSGLNIENALVEGEIEALGEVEHLDSCFPTMELEVCGLVSRMISFPMIYSENLSQLHVSASASFSI